LFLIEIDVEKYLFKKKWVILVLLCWAVDSRVTRLGDFSPLVGLFTLARFFGEVE
jgi:hypothetical protein